MLSRLAQEDTSVIVILTFFQFHRSTPMWYVKQRRTSTTCLSAQLKINEQNQGTQISPIIGLARLDSRYDPDRLRFVNG